MSKILWSELSRGALLVLSVTSFFGCSPESSVGGSASSGALASSSKASAMLAASTAQYIDCASENQRCSFSGSATVRYGANGTYVYKSFTDGVSCSNDVFGDPLYGTVKACAYAPDTSANSGTTTDVSSLTKCADENQKCSFTGTMQVTYGANNVFVTKTLTDGTSCSNDVFGDPLYGTIKACYISSAQSSGTPGGTSGSAASTKCADENQKCSFTGTMQVTYGANNSFVTKTLTNGTSCSNDVFGDPAYGIVKACYISSAQSSGGTQTSGGTQSSGGTQTSGGTPQSNVADIDLTNYKLTFDDEFDSINVATHSPMGNAKWYYLPPYGSAGYYSQSAWDASSFSVSNGVLQDRLFQDSSGQWHSGNISSIDETGAGFSQQYGYFEARVKMPSSGTGSWPAFWLNSMAGMPGMSNGATKAEELDIFEWYGVEYDHNEALIQQASHNWKLDGSGGDESVSYLYSPGTPMPGGAKPWEDFHVYGLLIDPVHITWYIDGQQTNQIATPTAYMNGAFYIMFDYAIGGGWPLSGLVNNSSFQIDWVRVYSLPLSR